MRVLLPISLDRWRNPISTLLRACVQYNPDIEFHSFTNPETDEDRELGELFWSLPNIHARHPSVLLKEKFDIVHTASYSHGNYMASVIAKLRGWGCTRFLDTMNLEQDPSHHVCWTRYKRVLRWVDGFVAVSEAVARDIRERVPERFMGVIPNGVDSRLYGINEKESDMLPAQLANLEPGYPLWLAAIEPRKHPEVFLQLAYNHPDRTFVALGQPIGIEGEQMISEWKRCDNILWLGGMPRRQTKAILANAGVLLFPSEREGLSLAMIEAVALGVPIVAQPKSSMPELVLCGVNGTLADVADTTAWNSALKVWTAPRTIEQQENLSRCRRVALEKYDWSRVGSSYGPIYRAMMERSPGVYRVNA